MNDKTHTVVGVLPPIPQFPQEHDVYMPTSACPFRAQGELQMNGNRSSFRALTAFGRIREGVDIDAVRADFETIGQRFARDYPETYPAESGYAITATSLQDALTEGARPTLLVGILAAFAAGRFLKGFLFETSPTDPLTFATVLLVLVAAALVASFLPARRAASIHPTRALRSE